MEASLAIALPHEHFQSTPPANWHKPAMWDDKHILQQRMDVACEVLVHCQWQATCAGTTSHIRVTKTLINTSTCIAESLGGDPGDEGYAARAKGEGREEIKGGGGGGGPFRAASVKTTSVRSKVSDLHGGTESAA